MSQNYTHFRIMNLLKYSKSVILIIIFICSVLTVALSSVGDNSNEFKGCFHTCHFNNCSRGRDINAFHERQSWFERFLLWSCEDECEYNCMWHTTGLFMDRGWNVPQFHGKWPFVRFWGLQEPASVVFSLLNLIAHVVNIKQFRLIVPSNAPLYLLWHLYFMVCAHAWFWSIVFHARDTPFTERMDYFSAFSMVLFSFVIFLIRVNGKKNFGRKVLISVFGTMFLAFHIWYLTSKKFDYGYNMKVNILVGLLNGIGWLWWSQKRSVSRVYVQWCRTTMIVLGITMALEILDFAPVLWVFDAHSLWHLSTVSLPYFWYRFIEGDCYFLLENSSKYSKKSA